MVESDQRRLDTGNTPLHFSLHTVEYDFWSLLPSLALLRVGLY